MGWIVLSDCFILIAGIVIGWKLCAHFAAKFLEEMIKPNDKERLP